MLSIKCPKCGFLNKDLGEVLPDTACEDAVIWCEHCGHEFKIGWYAVIELR